MKTGLRFVALACLSVLGTALLGLPATANDTGPIQQNPELIYKIYIPGLAKAADATATPPPTASPTLTATAPATGTLTATPRVTATGTGTPRATGTATATATSSPTPTPSLTPSGPTATPLPPGTVDLSIDGLEISQATQTAQNTITLVAGKATILRIYARTTGSIATANVSLAIAASRDGVVLAGSPLVIGPRTVSPSPARGTFDSSFNAALPTAWLSGRVTLTATLDSAGTVTEANEANNATSAAFTFVSVPPPDVMIVPIRYTHTPNGQVYPAPTVDTISNIIAKIYPVASVNISWHTPVNFTGDLGGSSAWSTLLNQVTSLRQSEVGSNSPRMYYALVSIQNSAGRWFNSGIAGIGWLGGNRASVGLDLGGTSSGFIAAHEIGHNLGRYHAPCGGPSGVDANYPYANASIGQFGLDIGSSRVWSPGAPDNAKDVMGYCNPKWISDYTYLALLNALRGSAQAQAQSIALPQPGVLVRADLPEGGAAVLQPAYALSNVLPDAPAASPYEVRLLGADGSVIAAQPVALLETSAHTRYARNSLGAFQSANAEQEAPAPLVRSIQAIVPQPAQTITNLQLLRDGIVIAERPMSALLLGQTSVIANLVPDAGGVLRWPNVGRPALVRVSADGGATWTTLAVDVTTGELQLDLTAPTAPPPGAQFQVVLSDAIP
jgi:hypothetical protein